MKNYILKSKKIYRLIVYVSMIASILAPASFGQGITSSAVKGKVADSSGGGIPGVEVTITHVPTGSAQIISTNSSGRYAFRGLQVGGPYEIVARSTGYESQGVKEIFLELSRTHDANFSMKNSDIVELESFTVTGDDDALFNFNSSGVGSVLGEDSILTAPKANRSFNDIARLDPRVVVTDASRGAGSISAAGQHIKMNSFQIDGVRINDQFGLGSDGSPALANPISLDTIGEIAVEISPYDVRQSGFTGASINPVTKGGSNYFSGSIYHYFENEDTRGSNPISGLDDVFDETTSGIMLGGPIIKDKLFFFTSYEELERNTSGPTPGFTPDPAELDRTIQFIQSEYGFDPGTWRLADGSTVALSDEKSLLKLDYIMNSNHRASLRWNKTEGNQPQFFRVRRFLVFPAGN